MFTVKRLCALLVLLASCGAQLGVVEVDQANQDLQIVGRRAVPPSRVCSTPPCRIDSPPTGRESK